MAEIYRNLLVIICLGLLGWGLIRIERIYQYPFFMGVIFISFLVPQAFALVNNPGKLDQESLERVLLMSSLCAASCWFGYQAKPNLKWLTKFQIDVDKNKLFQAAIFLMLMGYFFNFLLKNTDKAEWRGGAPTGSATIYIFFGQVIYIAFSIFLLEAIKKPSIQNIILTLLAGLIPLQTVLIGRRQPTMTFAIIVGLSFWLIRRYIPPRWLIILAIFLMAILIPAIGLMRGGFWDALFNGQWQTILSASDLSTKSLQKGSILELRNAAFLIAATVHLKLYGFGAGWWDAIIQTLIPGQILGFGFKQSLQFGLLSDNGYSSNSILSNVYGYTWHPGTTPTGVGDSFVEFGYLGCLTFALMAYFFKNLWISAYCYRSIFSSLLYMALISPAMLGLTHGIGRFLQEFIFQLGMISLVIFYSRSRQNNSSLSVTE